jgi:N-dimethylarginine dimethylaminohydrolase
MNEVSRLARVALKHARDAFVDQDTINAHWKALNFTAPPDFRRALEEYDRFVEILQSAGAEIHFLPRDSTTTLDSIYARDASIVVPAGIVACSMGKAARDQEPGAQERAFEALRLPLPFVGRIKRPGRLEGGDLVWLDPRTVVVGRGYRTNAEGIRQFRALVGDAVDVIEVALPHWHGPGDVMHLMSLISPIAYDVAVVYSPLLPVPFRELLLDRGYSLVEVPDDEFETMGCNVLALAPRTCLVLRGNRRTRYALERVADVIDYEGTEISVKGAGGPTCLTRPLTRGSLPAPTSDKLIG